MGNNQGIKKTPIVTVILTILAWMLVSILTLWPLLSIIWYLCSIFWLKELYIPYTVKVTVEKIILIIIWALLVGVIFVIHKIYKIRKLRSLYTESLDFNACDDDSELEWVEISYTKQDNEFMDHLNNLIENPVDIDFSKLLSYGVILFNKKRYIDAVNIYRFILSQDESPLLIKKISEYRLLRALPYLDIGGKSLHTKILGGAENETN